MMGLSLVAASAATITVSNLPGGVPVPILDVDGNLVTTGTVRLGTFDQGSDFSTFEVIRSSFRQFGDSVSIGLNGIDGLYQNTVTATVAGTAFSGANVVTVISEGLASDCSFVVVDHGFVFQDEPGFTPDAVITSDSTLYIGSSGDAVIRGQTFDGLAHAMFFECPEPSSALLSMMGLMICLVRRRVDSEAL